MHVCMCKLLQHVGATVYMHVCMYNTQVYVCICVCVYTRVFDKIFSLAQFKLYLSQFIFKTAHAYIGNCSQNKGLMNHFLWHIAG